MFVRVVLVHVLPGLWLTAHVYDAIHALGKTVAADAVIPLGC